MKSACLKQKTAEGKVACIIPARYASTRLPGKPLIEINGVPLIVMVYNRVMESNAFDEVIVATDDRRIMKAVEDAGGKAVMTLKKHKSGTDRIYEASHCSDCGYIVNVQGDEPLIPKKLLREFSASVRELDDNTLLTCATHATIQEGDNPNTVKVVLSADNYALYFSRSAIPFYRDGGCRKYLKHIGIYGFSMQGLKRFCSLPMGRLEKIEKLEQLRALEAKMKIRCLLCRYNGIGVDTPHDVEKLAHMLSRKRK
jgi:3-deoxy-manno-octulosonate cytidylyltransferase (CMP-KDO synthetase)